MQDKFDCISASFILLISISLFYILLFWKPVPTEKTVHYAIESKLRLCTILWLCLNVVKSFWCLNFRFWNILSGRSQMGKCPRFKNGTRPRWIQWKVALLCLEHRHRLLTRCKGAIQLKFKNAKKNNTFSLILLRTGNCSLSNWNNMSLGRKS